MQNPRPFSSVEEHDELLVANWNAAVRPGDTVWHLGDFCYRCSEDYALSVFGRLRGKLRFLIRGNHDRVGARLAWDGVFDVARVVVPGPDGVLQGVWMSHYAHRVWPRMHRGDLHFYGHSHGTLLDLTATKKFGKFEIGAVAYGVTDLPLGGRDFALASAQGYTRAGRFAVGGLIGYDFGPVTAQLMVARDVAVRTRGTESTDGFIRLIAPLYSAPKAADPMPVSLVRKY
jgi:calcineurin-like phosphoesterase family protein